MGGSLRTARQGGSGNSDPANVAVGRMLPRSFPDLPTTSRGAAAIVPTASRQTLRSFED
jgi:hypothetical protein